MRVHAATAVLCAALRAALPVNAQTNVDGTIGTTPWAAAGSPYMVASAVVVGAGGVLTIEPGVDVLFSEFGRIEVEGALYAIGTPTDSIRFVPGASNPWLGLRFGERASGEMRYVRVSGAYNEDPTTPSGNLGGGVFVSGAGSRLALEHCVIAGNRAHHGGGIYAGDAAHVVLRNSAIRANEAGTTGAGLMSQGATLVLTDCVISGNRVSGTGGGLLARDSATSILTNCTIANNEAGTGAGLFDFAGSMSILTNCTLSGNSAGVGSAIYSNGSTSTLVNCTVAGNSAAGGAAVSANATLTLTSSILWGGSGRQLSSWGGVINATYCDIEGEPNLPGPGNISADPLFESGSADEFRLGAGSPCIDAGDPETPKDTDGTRADIGANPASSVILSSETVTPLGFSLAQNSPNPFNPTTTILFETQHSQSVRLSVRNVTGQLVRTLVDSRAEAGRHVAVWDGRDDLGRAVSSGVYLYCLTGTEGVLVRGMMLVR